MILAAVIPLGAIPVAVADVSTSETAVISEAVDEQALAQYFSDLDEAQTEEEARDALVNFLGEDLAQQIIVEHSAEPGVRIPRSAGTFVSCIKGKASDDIKSVFDINVVAAALGQKDYVKAAKEAVKYLARQGVKRNVGALVGMFAYWGWQCRGSW